MRKHSFKIFLAIMAVIVFLGSWQILRNPLDLDFSPSPPEGFRAIKNLEYGEKGQKSNRLDLYVPEKLTGKRPLVIWIHGGSWDQGSKNDFSFGYYLLHQGFSLASLDYRFSWQARFPAQIHDCKAAIRWLRANARQYALDPDHFGVWGASAGGHLAALLGTTPNHKELEGTGGNPDQSSQVQAVVDYYGPSDFTVPHPARNDPNHPVLKLLGGTRYDQVEDRAILASPITHVSKQSAPFLILHGDRDGIVPLDQSQRLAEALKKAGVETVFQTIPGANHGGSEFDSPANQELIANFLTRHLKPGQDSQENLGKTSPSGP